MSASHDDIKQLTARLEELCPQDGAKVRIHIYGGGPDESCLVANRAGYLRMAVECLKAADTPLINETAKDRFSIQADWEYLFTEDSEVQIDWLERREDSLSPSGRSTLKERLVAMSIAILIFSGMLFAIIGVIATLIWLL